MNKIFTELRRRNIFRVAGVYAVVGWLLAQAAVVMEASIGLPDWFDGMIVAVLLLGFPLAMILAWAFELTPEGVKPTKSVSPSVSILARTGRKLDYAILSGLIAVIGLIGWQTFSSNEPGTVANTNKSIAVLPFVDLSRDGDQAFFADGISEEILNVLVRIPDLKVAGRTSSFSFRGQNEDLREIGAALDVNHVLEGSVRRSGTKLRITAQLIRGEDGFHLWSETYDRELTDIFEIQDDIARAVADQLAVSLGLSTDPLVRERTEDIGVYDNVLKAKQLFLRRGKNNLDRALLLLNDATARDADYAPSWSLIASIYTVYESYQPSRPTKETYEQWRAIGKAAARRAIELNPGEATAYANLASFYTIERDFVRAFEFYDRALELGSDNPRVLDSFAQNALEVGYYHEANIASKKAANLDPLVAMYHNTLARTYLHIGENQNGIDSANKSIAIDPQLTFPYNVQWSHFVYHDKYDDAIVITEQAIAAGAYFPEAIDTIRSIKKVSADNAALQALIGNYGPYIDRTVASKLSNVDTFIQLLEEEWANEYRPTPVLFTDLNLAKIDNHPRWKQHVIKDGVLALWRNRGFPPQCRPLDSDDFECD